jgi:hypothetical protein
MKKIIYLYSMTVLLAVVFSSCEKEYGNLNSPTIEDYTKNASKAQLDGLVAGSLAGMRNNEGMYLDVVGVIGREMYRFSNADPRYVTELPGSAPLNNTGFYITNPWGSRYRVVKNCNVLIDAATNSTQVSDVEKKGYIGFAKLIKAHQLLMNLNLTYSNGIRVDVSDPNNLGPILPFDQSLAAISSLLDESQTDLTGSSISFPLSTGFTGFSDAAGLIKFNRALAARVDVYGKQWAKALTDLNASFLDLNGSFQTGIFEVYGTGTGDQLNTAFFPQNQNGEVRLSHPLYKTDIGGSDDRIGKATLRAVPASNSGFSSDRDIWVYTTSTAPLPIIRNEELILIYAEAKIQSGAAADLNSAVTALNKIRNGHGLGNYAGAVTQSALITEMLYQRRYSLFYEGHRWVDMRRYDLLSSLPIDRTGDQVWKELPIPQAEE